MQAATDMLVAYWPVAAVAAVLLLVLVLPVRSLMRRTASAGPVEVPQPEAPPLPTPVQRLAASLEQAARERAQTAKVAVPPVAVPPPPRPSAWVARVEQEPPPADPQLPALPPDALAAIAAPAVARGPHRAFGRPQGLPSPRPEGRDDLKAIHGIGPRIERGLNALGIFHYEQIAAWDRRTVVWVENWFSLRGKIAKERWVEQARALAPDHSRPRR